MLSRARDGPRPTERLREPPKHHDVGVQLDALKTRNAQERKAVVVLGARPLG